MMSLLKFELYKIFRQKSIYIAFIILLGLITISLNALSIPDNSSYYKGWEGQVTEEKFEQAQAANSALMEKFDEGTAMTEDERAVSAVYENISYLHSREEKRQEKVEELTKLLQSQEESSTTGYEQRKTALELHMLQQFEINQLYYNVAPSEIIDFVKVFGVLLSGAMILVGLAPIFSNEYATGVDQFQLSSKYGRKRDVTAKIIAALLYVIFVIVIWVAYNVIHRITNLGDSGWGSPLQQLFQYKDSPYALDMLSYIGIQIGMHTLGAFGLALLVLLVSAWCRNTLLSFLISGFLFGMPIALDDIFSIEVAGVLGVVLDFSYSNIMIVFGLFESFRTLNVFGFPILYPIAAIGIVIALSAASMRLLYWTMKRKEVV